MHRLTRALAIVIPLVLVGSARAQPGDPMPPEDNAGSGAATDPGAAGAGTNPGGAGGDPGAGAANGTNADPGASGSADPGSAGGAGAGGSADPGTAGGASAGGSADPGSAGGAGGGGSADPGSAGGAGAGGSADPNGAGSAGAGAGAGSGSGSGAGPQILQLPTDIAAPQVSAAASPTVVRLGARFMVVIRATYGEGVEVNLREPVELGSIFEVRRKVSEDTRTAGGRTTREWQLEVTAWELGDLAMPPIAVTYTAFGKAGQVETNRVRLKIIGVLGDVVDDPKAMRDHAPPAELIARDWFWAYVAGAAGGVLVAALALLWVRKRRSRRRVDTLVAGTVARPRRIDMTSARALERLLAIEQAGVLDRDDERKAGYVEMIEVIRDYVGARYRIPTGELTSSELVRALARVAPDEERALVEAWFEGCDLVRYGGLRASRDEARRTLDDARALVVTTTQLQGKPAREAA